MGKSLQLQIRVTPRQKARLKRLAAAAGQDMSSYVLARALPSAQQRFVDMLAFLANGTEESEWRYGLAALHDSLVSLGADELREATARADVTPLTPFLQNYVAAMVEQAAHMKGVAPPAWTLRIVPLATPFFATPLKGLRLHLLRASPVPFKRRNIFVDATLGARV